MIKLADLHTYKEVTTDRDDTMGWHFGVCHLQVANVRYWWCGCRACGAVSVLALSELRQDRGCQVCGYSHLTSSNVLDFDWSADRSLRPWEMLQAEMSTAWRLGGADAVQALATELHEGIKADEQRHEERREAIRKLWQP